MEIKDVPELEACKKMFNRLVSENPELLYFSGETSSPKKDYFRIWFVLVTGDYYFYDLTKEERDLFFKYYKKNYKGEPVKNDNTN